MIEVDIASCHMGKIGAGFIVEMRGGGNIWRRTIPCGKVTANKAELKAVEFVLKSIKPQFEDEKVAIKSTGKYAALMVEKQNGEWVKTAINHIELVKVIREQFSRFKDIFIRTAEMPQLLEQLQLAFKNKDMIDVRTSI